MHGIGLGFVPNVIMLGMLAVFVAAVTVVVRLLWRQQRKARGHGYSSMGAYLRAAPRTDEERRDAADLALNGAVVCLLGLMFPPLLLVGLFPLFYGSRKLLYASMGLGLLDDLDGNHPHA